MNNLKKNQIVSFDYDNKARLGRVDCVHTVHPIWLDGPMVKGITVEVNDCEDGEQKFKRFSSHKIHNLKQLQPLQSHRDRFQL
jgi:hypothetical protein